ncbi:AAA family ATPase [Archangium primigenium]|uniref:AAA family ATPase n=1 Tax=[Archangium] primigenium TaxID=2792470 RepID=UPI0019592602|nr:AAA family ATPase [Archangium primigenium]
MIRQVHFENFRCLRDVTLTLEPLTVLVGPNSSGKTSVLEGLETLGRRFVDPWDFWLQEPVRPLRIAARLDSGAPFSVQSDHLVNGQYQLVSSSTLMDGVIQSLQLDLAALRQENVLANAPRLTRTGDNLTNVFASVTRSQQAMMAAELCRLVPMFKDVDLLPTDKGRHRLRFQDRWNPDFWAEPNAVSDGTMLLLAFIALQFQRQPVNLITIEDPERALHPYLLDELIQMLRKMTTGEIGRKPVQVVLATHSAELLEYVRPEEVRFLTRSPEDGSVQVNQAATGSENWRRVYEEYKRSLGSIWLSGGMGGVPGE